MPGNITLPNGQGKGQPSVPSNSHPIRINVDANARDILEASEGLGTNERLFFNSVYVVPAPRSKNYRYGQPLNKAEAKALDAEIRRQTRGEKSLLMLMEEEFRINGLSFDNKAMTKLYEKYKDYGLTNEAGMPKGNADTKEEKLKEKLKHINDADKANRARIKDIERRYNIDINV